MPTARGRPSGWRVHAYVGRGRRSPSKRVDQGLRDRTSTFDPKTDLRAEFSRFSPENLAANWPVVALLTRFARERGATPAQIALAWLLAQRPWIVPIPGTRNMSHLKENMGAIDVQLTPADLRELEAAFSKITVHGSRMSEKHMQDVDPA